MKATILARSESQPGESYRVEFAVNGDCVRVFCHCKAGETQHMCKHKLALIAGETKMLFDAKQAALLAEVRAWPQFAILTARVKKYVVQMNEIESAKDELAKRDKAVKTQMVHDLSFGSYTA